ncbi:MAG: FMN-binding protein [Lachnospiraceae bacterium]|nr:FMN-binding protein [Lachnospiraceae bacterium]MDD3614854.1 FMN-binding protein [Lachnospiraceae bacterium]
MKSFWIRLMNIVAITVLLTGYEAILTQREQEDKIARLNMELETAALETENVKQQLIINNGTDLGTDVSDGQDTGGNTGQYADGTYSGEAQGFGGPIAIDIVIENKKISEINIVSAENEDTAYLTMAEDIIPDIIESQSADVDTISGATFSSTGIKDAAAAALEEAEK